MRVIVGILLVLLLALQYKAWLGDAIFSQDGALVKSATVESYKVSVQVGGDRKDD